MESLGTVTICIGVNENATDSNIPAISPIQVDVVDSDAPMRIPHESLCEMKGSVDFESRTLEIPYVGEIALNHAKSGHLTIQWARPTKELTNTLSLLGHALYMGEM